MSLFKAEAETRILNSQLPVYVKVYELQLMAGSKLAIWESKLVYKFIESRWIRAYSQSSLDFEDGKKNYEYARHLHHFVFFAHKMGIF